VEKPENPQEKKNKDKFKIVSLAVKAGVEYTPELVRREILSLVICAIGTVVWQFVTCTPPFYHMGKVTSYVGFYPV
jgi:hypothetical protein